MTEAAGRSFHTCSDNLISVLPLSALVICRDFSSEFAGQILRIDGGQGIFLDVVWLSNILSPILDHKLSQKQFGTAALNGQRDSLINRGVLRWGFALKLWKQAPNSAGWEKREYVVNAVFRVLIKLGVIIPLGRRVFSADGRVDYKSKEMLVIMRLPEECTDPKKNDFDNGVNEALEHGREVKLKWAFDSAGAPYGLVERLIASCHVIGEVEQGACWRYGALFKSHERTERDGKKIRLYKFAIVYGDDPDHRDLGRILKLRMIGDLKTDLVWKAIQYVASAMVNLFKEWPGINWSGWADCPKHLSTRLNLNPPGQVGRA